MAPIGPCYFCHKERQLYSFPRLNNTIVMVCNWCKGKHYYANRENVEKWRREELERDYFQRCDQGSRKPTLDQQEGGDQ